VPRLPCASFDERDDLALVFTDVVMPGGSGKQLADEALRRRPHLKIIYTTGYTPNVVVHGGVLDPGVQLLTKPFTLEQLAAKVRAVLDGSSPAPEALVQSRSPGRAQQ
jgi:DNA-binding response OmpR family regulator